ncbi:MAG: hypothetical protein KGL39_41755, partial [Patescibacteria group bacterium]|nr:hypothetical protein [Patescibacteria group bacterium]
TPELSSEEKVALMDVQGLNLRLLIEPTDYESEGKITVKNEVDVKTPSERLRAVLYCLFKFEQEAGKLPKEKLFEAFYAEKMDGIIEKIKRLLPQE